MICNILVVVVSASDVRAAVLLPVSPRRQS